MSISIKRVTTAIVLAVCLCLCGCDNHGDKTAPERLLDLEPIMPRQAGGSRPGPHGNHDPHANLAPDKHIQVALQHLAEGRTDQAIGTLNQAIEKHPESGALYGVRGSLLLEQGQSAAALVDLNRAISQDPHNPSFLTNRAQAYRKFNRMDEAMADLDRAIELDDRFVAARFNRGSLAFNEGKYTQALVDFDACINTDPGTAAPYFNRASVHDAMGNRELAIADMKHFREIAPSEEWKDTANALLLQWESTTTPTGQSERL